jgi:hypothetical protein
MEQTALSNEPRAFYPPATIAKARALYIGKGLSITDVADKLKIPSGTVGRWCTKGGWTVEREKRAEKLEQVALARADDSNAAFMQSVATQTEDLTEDSFQIARNAIDDGDAKSLQMASGAIRNFVDVYRTATGMNEKNAGASVNIGQFFVNVSPPPAHVDVVETPLQLPAPSVPVS